MPTPQIPAPVMYILFFWSLFWIGISLWRAAHYRQRNWFVVILILNFTGLNTLGILELIYLLRFSKKRLTIEEMKGWKNVFLKQVPDGKVK